MNTTFVLGNGFDINLGLNTRYKDFYDYYRSIDSDNDVIIRLKQSINASILGIKDNKDDEIDWSDLELGLGEYTKHLSTFEEVDIIYDDLRDKLRSFINNEKKRLDSHQYFDISTLRKDLKIPERFLPPADQQEIQSYRQSFAGTQTNILSFNYTDPIKFLLSVPSAPDEEIKISNTIHIHRTTDDLVLGVNDNSQLANKELAKNEDVRVLLLKPLINSSYRDNHVSSCVKLIDKSQLICLFGVSMGDTDKYWWETIGKRVRSNNTRIIFYQYEKDQREYDGPHRFIREKEIRSQLMKKMGIADAEDQYRLKIFIDIMDRKDHIFNIGKIPSSKAPTAAYLPA